MDNNLLNIMENGIYKFQYYFNIYKRYSSMILILK